MKLNNLTKRCSKCNEIKPISDFHRHKKNKDGHTYHCKICRCISSNIYREINYAEIKIRKRFAYYRNRENILSKKRTYYIKNKQRYIQNSEIQRYGTPRIRILERDGFKCRLCGSTKNLAIHHIDGRGVTTLPKERNNNIENLITLCGRCHGHLHRNKQLKEENIYEQRILGRI